ncbi:MAG: biotin transporter BioY [Oscillospiraceae bacterium]|jgi:biotin transport system substrate-specific component|nr:biotin transporter BioY [Oscillospiraceae bacterium]
MKKTKNSLFQMILCAVFAALAAVLSQLGVTIGELPIVFTQVAIFLAGGLLGWKWGALSMVVYTALGAAGLPVFAGMSGGPHILFGYSGGFIFGYILAALTTGLLLDWLGRKPWVVFPVLALGALVIYLPGLPWMMHVLSLDFGQTIALGMLPYLPFDAAKVALAGILILALHPVLQKQKVLR